MVWSRKMSCFFIQPAVFLGKRMSDCCWLSERREDWLPRCYWDPGCSDTSPTSWKTRKHYQVTMLANNSIGLQVPYVKKLSIFNWPSSNDTDVESPLSLLANSFINFLFAFFTHFIPLYICFPCLFLWYKEIGCDPTLFLPKCQLIVLVFIE